MTGNEEYDRKVIGHIEETVRRIWEERHGEDKARRWSEGRKASARLIESLYGTQQENKEVEEEYQGQKGKQKVKRDAGKTRQTKKEQTTLVDEPSSRGGRTKGKRNTKPGG